MGLGDIFGYQYGQQNQNANKDEDEKQYQEIEGMGTFMPGERHQGFDDGNVVERAIVGNLESNYAHAKLEFSRLGVQRPAGRRVAVCIGCNYPHSPEYGLSGCVNDAKRWAELLSRNYNFQVLLLTDDPLKRRDWNNPTVPTEKNIMAILGRIVSRMRRGDCLFIQYSGHGTRQRDRDGDEDDGFDECLVLPDQSPRGIKCCSDDALYEQVCKRVPEGAKLTAIFDCCNSGGALDLDWNLKTSRNSAGQAYCGKWEKDGRRSRCETRGDITLISGCRPEQKSLELSSSDGGTGGALTLEMIKLLSRQPYQWTYSDLLAKTIQNIFISLKGKATSVQCPTLQSSIPFDVTKRMFGPCQLSGIQVPTKDNQRKPSSSQPHYHHQPNRRY